MSNKPKRPVLSSTAEESMVYPFSEEEYRRGISTLNNNKAAGIDDVLVEELKNTPGLVDRPRRSDFTASHMDGEAGWWTTSGNIGLPPLARVMGVGRQQQQLTNLGPKTQKLLLGMLNNCFAQYKIPRIWRKSKIIAILKAGKDT